MLEILQRLTAREQSIVILALLVAVAIGVHALLIEPYELRMSELEEAIEQQRDDLAWMRSTVARMPSGEVSGGNKRIEGTLVNFLNQAISRQGLAQQLSQMSPIGNDEVRMRYSGADFNRLVGFIAQVGASGLEIKDLRISAAENPGVVDCSLVLVRQQ